MQTRSTIMMAAVTAFAALSQPASAVTVASATTPLNIRSGPGPQYSVIGAIPDKGQATILGCIQGSLWCQVAYNGKQGWAYSQYLTATIGGRSLAVAQTVTQLPQVTYAPPPATVGTAVVEPTIAGDFIAPAGAPVSLAPPPPTVQTYVVSHPVAPVYLNGEVVEGAGLPETVVLNPVPDTQYEYAYVNGVPVLVEPQTRRVTYIYR
jgi:uncharacterized protein YraI